MLALWFVAALCGTAEGQSAIANIDGQPGCDRSKYHDPPVGIAEVASPDSLLAVIERLAPQPDILSLYLRYAKDGSVREVEMQSNAIPKEQWPALVDSFKPYITPTRPQSKSLFLAITVRGAGESTNLALRAAEPTCEVRLRTSSRALTNQFDSLLARMWASTGTQPFHGRVTLLFSVMPDGIPKDITVSQSSGAPAADSVAIDLLRGARFWPLVIGRTAVAAGVTQSVSF